MTTTRARKSERPQPLKKRAAKAKGLSLHIGLNAVDPDHYEGWSGELVACQFDARDMAAIAEAIGLQPKMLLTRKATRAAVLKHLRSAARDLRSGDLFFLTYSGHGGQVDDVTGEERGDKLDETWCLYDGQLIDDELYLELTGFRHGVRIVVLSDSCHSGTVTRAAPPHGDARVGRVKMMPPVVAARVYRTHKGFYDALQRSIHRRAGQPTINPDDALAHVAVSHRLTAVAAKCQASVILISGCQDNQTSMDGDHNGAFTEQLLRVWKNGAFKGSYATFHSAIKAAMDARQTPNLFTLGPAAAFVRQRPFQL